MHPVMEYVTDWRIREAMKRLNAPKSSSILVLCCAEAHEASIICNIGFSNVTISDISPVALDVALKLDNRLSGLILDAGNIDLPDNSFDVVVLQDGLHHLQNPVGGMLEMLRVAKRAIVFLEPHDSIIGKLFGTVWENNDGAINYVFRWSRKLVQDVASSYFSHDRFTNLSFSFCHHNLVYDRYLRFLGVSGLAALKATLDFFFGRFGNQFCGIVVKP
jgi:ubiquinone/menaquinone biosynthesis C-methylase UbiE